MEWFAGEWQGFDPTNNIEIGDRHVLVGRGRDYNDVPPLRGVYAGPFKSQLYVQASQSLARRETGRVSQWSRRARINSSFFLPE